MPVMSLSETLGPLKLACLGVRRLFEMRMLQLLYCEVTHYVLHAMGLLYSVSCSTACMLNGQSGHFDDLTCPHGAD